jgi:hypothetical protein
MSDSLNQDIATRQFLEVAEDLLTVDGPLGVAQLNRIKMIVAEAINHAAATVRSLQPAPANTTPADDQDSGFWRMPVTWGDLEFIFWKAARDSRNPLAVLLNAICAKVVDDYSI